MEGRAAPDSSIHVAAILVEQEGIEFFIDKNIENFGKQGDELRFTCGGLRTVMLTYFKLGAEVERRKQ